MNDLQVNTPTRVLAAARTFACMSAAKCRPHDVFRVNSIMNTLNQPMYIPRECDDSIDCRPYLPATRATGERVIYMPAWARAGVRYVQMGVDVKALDPRDWMEDWWVFYRAALPNLDQDSETGKHFIRLYESLGTDEDEIRVYIDQGRLVTDREPIRNLIKA